MRPGGLNFAVSSLVLLAAGGVTWNPWVLVGGGMKQGPSPSRVGSPRRMQITKTTTSYGHSKLGAQKEQKGMIIP